MNDFVLDLREHDEEHAIFELSALMLFPHPIKRADEGYYKDWVMRVLVGVAATKENAGDQEWLGAWIGGAFLKYGISWRDVATSLFQQQSKRPLPIQASRDRRVQGLQSALVLCHAIEDGHGIQGACRYLASDPCWKIKSRTKKRLVEKEEVDKQGNRENVIRRVFKDFRPVVHLWTAFRGSIETMKRIPGGLLPLGQFSPGGLHGFVQQSTEILKYASTIATKTRPNDPLLSFDACWKIEI